jgi:hypothetical protein
MIESYRNPSSALSAARLVRCRLASMWPAQRFNPARSDSSTRSEASRCFELRGLYRNLLRWLLIHVCDHARRRRPQERHSSEVHARARIHSTSSSSRFARYAADTVVFSARRGAARSGRRGAGQREGHCNLETTSAEPHETVLVRRCPRITLMTNYRTLQDQPPLPGLPAAADRKLQLRASEAHNRLVGYRSLASPRTPASPVRWNPSSITSLQFCPSTS